MIADWRRFLVLAMVAAWGGRLAWHVRSRAIGDHGGKEDPRYTEMLGGSLAEVGIGTAIRRVFLVQGVAQWFIALPVAVGGVLATDYPVAVGVGVAVWLVGLFFETVGDRQLAAYKRIPKAERPIVMETGSGASPATPTTSVTPASGGASGSRPGWRAAGWPGCAPCCARWR